MDGFEQSNKNMITHNRMLPEAGSYILPVDTYVLYTEIDKNKLYFQSICCYIFKNLETAQS